MQTYGRTLREAARQHLRSLNALLSHTVTRTPVRSRFYDAGVDGKMSPVVSFTFQNPAGGPGESRLSTRYGPMEFTIVQICDAVPVPHSNQLRLRMIDYRYALQPVAMNDPLIRWEYVRFPGDDARWNLHHVQGLIQFEIPGDRGVAYPINLNDWHLPTGRVDIEDVIRFCLHDLGARPLNDDWHETLLASRDDG